MAGKIMRSIGHHSSLGASLSSLCHSIAHSTTCRFRFDRTLLTFLLLMLASGGCVHRSEYPNRPIVLICPWSAGGGTDRTSRQVAALLERELDVPVNVVNATGGAGVTGHTRGALARPDGYTLTMVTVEINMLHWRHLTNISHQDFVPVGMLNRDAAAVFVRGDAPWQTLAELEAEVRKHPGEVKASGTAEGGIWHLAFAGWLDTAGLKPGDAIWISINGSAPSLQELIAGGVDVVCCSLPEAQSLMDSGRVRSLGVMADERIEQFPDVPTFREQDVDWTLTGWRGICLPQGTPPDISQQLTAALERVAHSDLFREFMRNAGFDVAWQGPDEFAQTMQTVDSQLGKLLTSESFQTVRHSRFSPMVFPTVLFVAMAVVCIGLVIGRKGRDRQGAQSFDRLGAVRFAAVVACVVGYVLVAEWAGFLITAGILSVGLLRLQGNRWRTAILVSVILVPTAYELFAVLLRVPLPRGWIGW